jgi:uncharacterized protein YbbC (DUF1343 family)
MAQNIKQKAINMKFFVFFLSLFALNCQGPAATGTETPATPASVEPAASIVVGAERLEAYLPLLEGKTIALVVNHTARVSDKHLVDTLLALGVSIKAIFAPEHGFRGDADAGAKIHDAKDPHTGLPLISLYGQKRAPSAEDLRGVDGVVFDIQDVGARFYTLHYVMRACAEQGVPFIVLDRPNPNGHYMDGPLLRPGHESFVGVHPIPIVHGMTVGELARMINGEGWLGDGLRAALTVIPCEHYHHRIFYELPVAPSPNLRDMRAIYLYPSTCLFEGTVISEGRGTPAPFQIFGHPDLPPDSAPFAFTPRAMPGAQQPKLKDQLCRGFDLSNIPLDSLRQNARVDLQYLLAAYRLFPRKDQFFLANGFFDKLAGGSELRESIVAGQSEEQIRVAWAEALRDFRDKRKQYLLYEE